MFYANTSISIASAKTSDPRGDRKSPEPDSFQWTGIVASLIEQTQIVTNPEDGIPREIHYATMRVQKGTEIKKTDRVKDEKTGQIYVVTSCVSPTTHFPVNFGLKVMLRRVGDAV